MADHSESLRFLLDLNGVIYPMDNGYWTKFEVHLVEQNDKIPHGVSYSLTLHDRNNTRILGFDNAHACHKPSRKKYGGRKVTWDHVHKLNRVVDYEFDSPGQLLQDFWQEVEEMI